MKDTDRFLLGMVAGILALVVVAFVLVLRQPEPTYRDDDSPAAAVHNYLLATHRKEFERAYEYLSPTVAGYPETEEAFLLERVYRRRDAA